MLVRHLKEMRAYKIRVLIKLMKNFDALSHSCVVFDSKIFMLLHNFYNFYFVYIFYFLYHIFMCFFILMSSCYTNFDFEDFITLLYNLKLLSYCYII